MHIILVPIGSAGDVHPYIGLGRELKRRGHRVTVLTNDYFKALAESAGLEFAATGTAEEFKDAMEDPRLWDPKHAFEFVVKLSFAPLIPIVYDFLKERNIPGQTLVVGSSLAWGALIAQEKLGIPMVTLHLQPSVLMSAEDMPLYNGMTWIPELPKPLRKVFLSLVDAVTDRITTPEINKFRASIGLPPVRRILRRWTHSPLKTIGLFPEWYAPPQPDWPAGVTLTGFPLYDADDLQTMPPELDAFLKAGPPPVVFTAGSAMKQARALFAVSAETCRRLGCRGVLVNKFPDQLPASLPPGVVTAGYAPFSLLFRQAAAVVHHGGIGTTAQAFAAGVPQIVTPFAHDQFDNAHRVERSGTGKRILPKNYGVEKTAAALKELMCDGAVRKRASEIRRLEKNESISKTCDVILKQVR